MKKTLLVLAIVAGLTSFSAKITGPKHKVEGGVGLTILSPTLNVSYTPEWKAEINRNFDITFGPELSVTGDTYVYPPAFGGGMTANVGFEVDFNVKVEGTKNKFYVGLETGTGVGIVKVTNNDTSLISVVPNFIGKVTLGGKINDKYNVGFYAGYGKGIVGFEAGYTF
ncbi:hypothetical protein [Streptobacillus canis]|uniref:hypothetical protein n=1 Tax=Streptobacillus canis TaxID=2678686 RepID=UPI0012E17C23|nr:hypothetical protein [Streptobacillus canis]